MAVSNDKIVYVETRGGCISRARHVTLHLPVFQKPSGTWVVPLWVIALLLSCNVGLSFLLLGVIAIWMT